VSAAMVLDEARRAGVELFATPTGMVRWRGPLPEQLRRDLIVHKAEVLAALRHIAQWDPAAADAVLADLQAEVDKIRTGFGGRAPELLDGLLDIALKLGERYIREHEQEAAHGWDPLELLRDLVPFVRELAARQQATKATTDPVQMTFIWS